MNKKENKNTYGENYLPDFENTIQLYVDENGENYSENQHLARFYYKWSQGDFGIGYYLQYDLLEIEDDNEARKKLKTKPRCPRCEGPLTVTYDRSGSSGKFENSGFVRCKSCNTPRDFWPY